MIQFELSWTEQILLLLSLNGICFPVKAGLHGVLLLTSRPWPRNCQISERNLAYLIRKNEDKRFNNMSTWRNRDNADEPNQALRRPRTSPHPTRGAPDQSHPVRSEVRDHHEVRLRSDPARSRNGTLHSASDLRIRKLEVAESNPSGVINYSFGALAKLVGVCRWQELLRQIEWTT